MVTPSDLQQVTVLEQQVVGVPKGRTGLQIYAGHVWEDYQKELRGSSGVKIFDEMRRSEPVIASMLAAILTVFQGVQFNIVAGDGSGKKESTDAADLAAKELVQKSWANLATEELLENICTMFAFGWSLLEPVYTYKEGRIYWDRMPLRGQDTLYDWKFDDVTGEVTAFVQRPAPSFKEITIERKEFLLFRTSSEKGNPEGLSLLRAAYKPYYYKRTIEEVEIIGAERDLVGIPVMKVPYNASESEAEEARQIVERVAVDEQVGIVMTATGPEQQDQFEFSLLTGQGSSAKIHSLERVVQRLSTEMTMVALAQFLRLGADGTSGGYNLSSDQRDLFQVALRGYLKRIATVFNLDAIPRLLAMNGMRGKATMVPGRVSQLNLQVIANFITSGVQNKWLTADGNLEAFLRQEAELPPLDEATKREAEPPPMAGEGKDNSGVNSNPGENQKTGMFAGAAAGAKIKGGDQQAKAPSKTPIAASEEQQYSEDYPLDFVEVAADSGMVALWVPPDLAAELAYENGEDPEDMHITLAYIPDMLDSDKQVVQDAMARVAAGFDEGLRGRVSGYGRFYESTADCIIALPDIPGLPELRQLVMAELRADGIEVSEKHGYTPHITLAYVARETQVPMEKPPEEEWEFGWLEFRCGGETLSAISLFTAELPAAEAYAEWFGYTIEPNPESSLGFRVISPSGKVLGGAVARRIIEAMEKTPDSGERGGTKPKGAKGGKGGGGAKGGGGGGKGGGKAVPKDPALKIQLDAEKLQQSREKAEQRISDLKLRIQDMIDRNPEKLRGDTFDQILAGMEKDLKDAKTPKEISAALQKGNRAIADYKREATKPPPAARRLELRKQAVLEAMPTVKMQAGVNRELESGLASIDADYRKRIRSATSDEEIKNIQTAMRREVAEFKVDFQRAQADAKKAEAKRKKQPMTASEWAEFYSEQFGYNPSQPRGKNGKWTAVGGGVSAAAATVGLHKRALAEEAHITRDLKSVVGASGGEMAGLEYSVKGISSLQRKIKADAKDKGISHEEAAAQIGDSVRYTSVFPANAYASGTQAMIGEMQARGYEIVKVKNFWTTGPGDYHGVNMQFRSPSGLKVELQSHTPESFAIKQLNHKHYEEWRTSSSPMVRKGSYDKMVENWRTVARPADIEALSPMG